MRLLWFIPHGITFTRPERTSRYWGGFSSTVKPIGRRQAAAVVANGQRYARELVSLLEGAGFVVKDEGSEAWNRTYRVGEGFNRFDPGSNGRIYNVNIGFFGPPMEFDELAQHLAALPWGVVAGFGDQSSPYRASYVMSFNERYGHSGNVTLSQRKDAQQITAGLSVHSRSHFYGWAKHDPLWRILRQGRSEDADERIARERKRLGFQRQPWLVHAAPPGGMRRSEARRRIRLYLRGAGVKIKRMRFRLKRAETGWNIALSGSPTTSLKGLHITDEGYIQPLD
ncbi:hypothetical protein AB0N05_21870 [Nocardia sp. NPDC051030]|uniref:hypothetical protein n=1 Tax=Nocardia sp. NPDC051030 TaxID=3155162 RepID=UPI003412A574